MSKKKKYEVIEEFKDLQDDGHIYHKGNVYPRNNKKVDEERIVELSSSDNKIGKPLIKLSE